MQMKILISNSKDMAQKFVTPTYNWTQNLITNQLAHFLIQLNTQFKTYKKKFKRN